MGKCIKCNSYCKDYYDYCKECYSKLLSCDICIKTLDPDKDKYKFNDYDGIICEECYLKIKNIDHRKNYIAEYRTKDGHYVRSKSELAIDNYLYNNNIIHAYEKKIFNNVLFAISVANHFL